MKIIINESQLRLIVEDEENKGDNLINLTAVYNSGIPPEEWDGMYEHMNTKKKGGKYDGYYINGDVDLEESNVTELNYLVKVGDNLYLNDTQIKSLPMLKYVGGSLYLRDTPLSKTTTRKELRSKINVEGHIYL